MRILLPLFLSVFLLQSCIQSGSTNNNIISTPVEIKLNFKPGIKYTYTNETNDTVGVPSTAKQMSLTTRTSITNTFLISNLDKNKRIDFSYDKIIINSPAGEINTDDSANDLMMLNGLKKEVHVQRTAILTDNGEIKGIQKTNADSTANAGDNTISLFTNDAITGMLKYYFDFYPKKPVKLGERWTKTMAFNLASIKTAIPIEYRLITTDNGIAHIEMNADVKNLSDSMAHAILHFTKMNGNLSGTMDVDIATGLILNYDQATTLKGTMNIAAQQIPANIISNMHIAGKELK